MALSAIPPSPTQKVLIAPNNFSRKERAVTVAKSYTATGLDGEYLHHYLFSLYSLSLGFGQDWPSLPISFSVLAGPNQLHAYLRARRAGK
jgi:hypothetical protein